MTAAQRKARTVVWCYGVECEIALSIAADASSDRVRQHQLERAARLADQALAVAPSTQPTRGAA